MAETSGGICKPFLSLPSAVILNIKKQLINLQISNSKGRICPDHWISNRMPCVLEKNGAGCGNRDYFIIKGKRVEFNTLDIDWVKENCKIKPDNIY